MTVASRSTTNPASTPTPPRKSGRSPPEPRPQPPRRGRKRKPHTKGLARGLGESFAMRRSTLRRRKRQLKLHGPDLFDWARENELRANPSVRAIARRTGASPALALLYTELGNVGGCHER